MFDSLAEALKKHMAKAKSVHTPPMGDAMTGHDEPGEGSRAEEATDRAPALADGRNADPVGMAPGKGQHQNAVDGDGVEEQMHQDPMADHHPLAGHPARSGGGLSPEEHNKILHAISSVGPVGRGSMTLGERAGDKARAQQEAIHAKMGKK